MLHPQTEIKKFNDNTCLFICYLYCVGIEPDSLESWMDYYKKALSLKVLDKDGFVLDAPKLLKHLTGKTYSVTKKAITDIDEVVGMAPVLFSIDGENGHFVVVENGKIIFDPLENSRNVKYGHPISAREIKLI